MKLIASGVLIGVLLTISIQKYFKRSIEVKTTVIYDNKPVENVVTKIEYDRKYIYVTNDFFINDKEVEVVNKVERIPFNHSLLLSTGYFMNTQLLYLDLGYSYKWIFVSAKVGYSFNIKQLDYGIGIGAKFNF